MSYLTKLFMGKTVEISRKSANICHRAANMVLPVLFLLVSAVFTHVFGQKDADLFPPKPEPAVYVHDYAGWLSSGQKAALEQKLRTYWDSTSTQIVVMIRKDIGDYDKASYAFELGKRWGIGRADKDNGVVMLIKSDPPDRGIFIATGYGAEGAIPDITAGQIIRNTMAPYFRKSQYYEGIDAGLNDIIGALKGEFRNDAGQGSDEEALLVVALVFLTVFLLLAFFIYRARKNGTVYTHDGRGYRRTIHRDTPSGGGWWWGTGGGSGGGWGDSGGGGWGDGGSFGGGDFGGGGAGGDW